MRARLGAWLRRNRWGLVGLPVAAALLLAGNGQRIQDWFVNDRLVHEVGHGQRGEWVHVVGRAPSGSPALDFRVTGLTRIDSYEGAFQTWTLDDPAYDVWEVTVEARARRGADLSGCTMAVVEADGTRYEWYGSAGGIEQDPVYPCLPSDAYQAGERPAQWTVRPVFFVPRGTRVTQVLLWWMPPRYGRVTVGSASG